MGREADERPEPRSLGLLPSEPDPVGEWSVHRQPPVPISYAVLRLKKTSPSWPAAQLLPARRHATVAYMSEQLPLAARPRLGPKPRLGYTAGPIERAAHM